MSNTFLFLLASRPAVIHNLVVCMQALVIFGLVVLVVNTMWWKVHGFLLTVSFDVFLECLQVRRDNLKVYGLGKNHDKSNKAY